MFSGCDGVVVLLSMRCHLVVKHMHYQASITVLNRMMLLLVIHVVAPHDTK